MLLRAVRHIFLGPPAASKQRLNLLRYTKPNTFIPVDEALISKALGSTVRLRFLGFLAASYSAYLFPVMPLLWQTVAAKAVVGGAVYRVIQFATWNKIERELIPMVEKYQLEKRPELLMTEEELKAMWKEMRDAQKAAIKGLRGPNLKSKEQRKG